LQAIDGPYLLIKDLDGFRDMSMRARALGYDGKWALHPGQIDVLTHRARVEPVVLARRLAEQGQKAARHLCCRVQQLGRPRGPYEHVGRDRQLAPSVG
jgi:citrate lyase beta subunit